MACSQALIRFLRRQPIDNKELFQKVTQSRSWSLGRTTQRDGSAERGTATETIVPSGRRYRARLPSSKRQQRFSSQAQLSQRPSLPAAKTICGFDGLPTPSHTRIVP